MFLQNIMVAARGRGLRHLPAGRVRAVPRVIRRELGIPENEMVVCGMSLGHEDPSAIENTLRTERAPLDGFVEFRDA